jgi:flagellar protein FlaI
MVNNQKFTSDEKTLLNNIRSKLADLAISNKETEELAELDTIKNMLKLSLNESIQEDYVDDLSLRFYEYINGYGIINPLIKDDNLEEIMVIGSNKPVYVFHRKYGMMETNIQFNDDNEIIRIIDSIARANNRRFDNESPILDGRLEDGSRVNGTLSPVSADGPTLTIRKFRKDPFTIIDLIRNKTLDSTIAAFLWLCIDGLGINSSNIIISGGTSSGKTTTLNALAALINPKERIITIEDTLELQIPHKHIIRLETRLPNIEGMGELNMDDLLKNSLRQRPDRIIVGEVRGFEAITLFTALNTGHSGFGTLHANSARETITRLINPPMSVPKIMISAIDFILMQKRIYLPNGSSYRRVTEISEVVGMEEGTVQLNKLFVWDPITDSFKKSSISSKMLEKLKNLSGINFNDLEDEIKKRRLVLDLMVKNNLRSSKILAKMVEAYYLDSDKVLNDLRTNIDS